VEAFGHDVVLDAAQTAEDDRALAAFDWNTIAQSFSPFSA
jgi:hypothetical protein